MAGDGARFRAAMSVAAVAAALVALPAPAAEPIGLGEPQKVRHADNTACPVETEPQVAATAAGTWVAYTASMRCVGNGTTSPITELQIIPPGAPPRPVTLPAVPNVRFTGWPDIAADADGKGVVLASLTNCCIALPTTPTSNLVGVVRIGIGIGKTVVLPSPTENPAAASVERVSVAVDVGRGRWRGRIHVAWGETSGRIVARTYDGQRWLPPVALTADSGGQTPDVAVARDGRVAVAYDTSTGIDVRISADGGKTYAKATTPMVGETPGRYRQSCMQWTIGTAQRVGRGPRVSYDPSGVLHVVASLGTVPPASVTDQVAAMAGASPSVSLLVYTSSRDGRRWAQPRQVFSDGQVRWLGAVAAAPGGIVVMWLQLNTEETTYDTWLTVLRPGGTRVVDVARLSPRAADFAVVDDATPAGQCHGIGDYAGLAATKNGVVAAWPTTDEVDRPRSDVDIYVREATVR